jgi:hypothetical protein
MKLEQMLCEVWRQALLEGREEVEVDGTRLRTGRTRARGLRTVEVRLGTMVLEGIEQNPEKESQWAKLAREGHQIMQFRIGARYVGVVCDGALTKYPAWRSLNLPD